MVKTQPCFLADQATIYPFAYVKVVVSTSDVDKATRYKTKASHCKSKGLGGSDNALDCKAKVVNFRAKTFGLTSLLRTNVIVI